MLTEEGFPMSARTPKSQNAAGQDKPARQPAQPSPGPSTSTDRDPEEEGSAGKSPTDPTHRGARP